MKNYVKRGTTLFGRTTGWFGEITSTTPEVYIVGWYRHPTDATRGITDKEIPLKDVEAITCL